MKGQQQGNGGNDDMYDEDADYESHDNDKDDHEGDEGDTGSSKTSTTRRVNPGKQYSR
jgi:hypothetical protein